MRIKIDNDAVNALKAEYDQLKKESVDPQVRILNDFIKLRNKESELKYKLKHFRKVKSSDELKLMEQELKDTKRSIKKMKKENPEIEDKSFTLHTRIQNYILQYEKLKKQEIVSQLCGVKRTFADRIHKEVKQLEREI